MRKLFLITAAAVIFFTTIIPQQSSANGLVKIVIGSAAYDLVRAIGEKAGMAFRKDSLDSTVNYINTQSHNGNEAYQKFVQDLNIASENLKPKQDEPGWKKYALDPLLWLSGLDLIVGAYQAFDDARTSGGTVPMYGVPPNMGFSTFTSYTDRWRCYVKAPSGVFPESDISSGHGKLLPESTLCAITEIDVNKRELGGYGIEVWTRATNGDSVYSVGFTQFSTESDPAGEKPFIWTPNDLNVPSIPFGTNNPYPKPTDPIVNTPIDLKIPDEANDQAKDSEDPWNPEIIAPEDVDGDKPPEDKPEGSSWWEWLLKPLIDLIKSAVGLIGDVLAAIGGLAAAIAEAIAGLLIPESGFFTSFFDDIHSSFIGKIPIIDDMSSFFQEIENVSVNVDGAPTEIFTIDLPESMGGGSHSILNLAMYDQYRVYILNFIRFMAWFVFLKRLWNRLPHVIY